MTRRALRICFLGESFVNGTGDTDCLGWTGRICAAAWRDGHDVTCYNLGIRRETSDDLAERWLSEVSRRLPPEHDGRVVFSFGVNDTTLEATGLRVAPDDSLANARRILIEAARSFPVLMIGPPPMPEADQTARITRLSGRFARLCAELGVPYLDVVTPLSASDIWLPEAIANDGAHPGAAGYAELARLVQSWEAWRAWFR